MRILIGLTVLAIVAAPASANYLVNAGFEDRASTAPPTGWTGYHPSAWFNSNNPGDHCPWPPNPEGDWWAAQGSGSDGGGRGFYQTTTIECDGPNPDCQVTYGGNFYYGGSNMYDPYLEIHAGADIGSGSLLHRVPLNNDGALTEGQFIIGPCPGTYEVTFIARIESDDGDWSGAKTLGGDATYLEAICGPEPASLLLIGLAGLPFLRRRR